MRVLIVLTVLAALALAMTGFARGEDGDAEAQRLMKKRLEVLELQVAYLLEREKDLSDYVVANLERGRALERQLARSRSEGFTKAAISSTSRELLLRALETQAQAMQSDLPILTEEQERLLKEIDARKRAR